MVELSRAIGNITPADVISSISSGEIWENLGRFVPVANVEVEADRLPRKSGAFFVCKMQKLQMDPICERYEEVKKIVLKSRK